MANWPSRLPDCPLPDFTRTGPTGNVMRTEMDVGPAKTRRRGSVGVIRYAMRFRLTAAQMAVFIGWYEDGIGQGAEAFDFRDPVEHETRTFRFATEGYTLERLGSLRYMLSVDLERLP